MKRTNMILALLAALAALHACDDPKGNGRLDGMWQMQRIEWIDGGAPRPDSIYYSFQRRIANLRRIGKGERFAALRYEGDSLHLSVPQASPEAMILYGLDAAEQHFRVERLTGSTLVLSSRRIRLELKRY